MEITLSPARVPARLGPRETIVLNKSARQSVPSMKITNINWLISLLEPHFIFLRTPLVGVLYVHSGLEKFYFYIRFIKKYPPNFLSSVNWVGACATSLVFVVIQVIVHQMQIHDKIEDESATCTHHTTYN